MATIFVTELRAAGLPVKLVGLHAQQLGGAHGLSLLPDLTLGQALALAGQAASVIMPCTAGELLPFKIDPRLADFLSRARANNALFVIKESPAADAAELPLPPSLLYAPASEELFCFVQQLISRLSAKPA